MENKWVPPNSTDFIDFIDTEFKKYKTTQIKEQTCEPKSTTGEVKKLTPTPYQAVLKEYINDKTPYRGVLLYHGLGSGKTFTALNIAEGMNRDVIVLLPASLKGRWISEFSKLDPIRYGLPKNFNVLPKNIQRKVQQELEKEISKKYTFISHNAYNVADKLYQLKRKEIIKVNVDPNENFSQLTSDLDTGYVLKHIGSLDNKLLIIDEVHNVLTNIINDNSKNGQRIYDMVMNAKNLKILALSGTPIVNDPFELAVLFNMLRGKIFVAGSKNFYTAFPEDYTDYKRYFLDEATNTMINKNIFQERIIGLVSFVRGSSDENLKVYPKKESEVVKVPMSLYQWKVYVKARQKEIEKEQKNRGFLQTQQGKKKLKKPSGGGSIDFKTASRAACNFAFPEEIEKPKAMTGLETIKDYKDRVDAVIQQLDAKYLVDKLDTYSPKYKFILDLLEKTKKGLVLIYSDFLTLEGIGLLKRVLDLHGYGQYEDKNTSDYKRYGEFTGDIDDEKRNRTIETYKDMSNKEGKNMRLLLVTSAAAEGLDLIGVRYIVLMEPYFHNNVLHQVIGRGVRRCSHVHLQEKERNVKVYLLVAAKPSPALAHPSPDKMTTDELLLKKSYTKEIVNTQFLQAMREASVDCELNSIINKSAKNPVECSKCEGKYHHKNMFEPNIEIHMIKGNSHCIKPEQLVIEEMIEIDGREYGLDQRKNVYDISVSPPKKIGKLKGNKIV